jgi:hypothetical protein
MNQKQSGGNLVFLNFVTDKSDPLLGFSHDWVDKIRQHFNHTTVVSGKIGVASLRKNVDLVEVGWERGHSFRNFFRSLWKINSSILKSKPHVVFTHMNYWFSIFAFPASLFVGARRVLWYAHSTGSLSLRVALTLSHKVITPIVESFPFSSQKVIAIGHAVDDAKFVVYRKDLSTIETFVHVGRADSIKRIDFITDTLRNYRKKFSDFDLSFIQVGSNFRSDETLLKSDADEDWIKCVESVDRDRLPNLLIDQKVFLHARLGSIDKAPLEAALAGLIVLTDDPLTYRELGSSEVMGEYTGLASQLEILHELSESERVKLQYVQRQNVLKNHSLSTLGRRFISAVAQSQS